MDAATFPLAMIREARYALIRIKTRIANSRQRAGTFRRLTNNLDKLMRQMGAVETYLGSAPTSAPTRIRSAFLEEVESVRDILHDCESTLKKGCAKALLHKRDSTLRKGCAKVYKGSKSGTSSKFKSLRSRTTRAPALSDTMKAVRQQVRSASTKLETLIATFVTEEHIDVVVPKLENLGITGNEKEVYRVGRTTPVLPVGTTLDFDSKDEGGTPCTPEGMLKESILSSNSSSAVTAATGVLTPAYGVIGMSGVGKTIALIGLAFDEDIRTRFPDGLHYMLLGQKASFLTVREEVAKIMRSTGASASVSAVEQSASLGEVIDYAVAWFHERICLFLVDDLWPTDENKTGFLSDIIQLLRSCPESRMAITTRSTHIAHSAGSRVNFSPRAALGDVSLSLFMTHARQDAKKCGLSECTGDLRKSIMSILQSCGGLPIALAVAGSAVGFLDCEQGGFEGACREYASLLEKKSIEVDEEQRPGGWSFATQLAVSIKIVEATFVRLKITHGVVVDYTIADLYTSLCVLRNQAWVPVSVLSLMWKVAKDFALDVVRLLSGLSLCKLTFRDDREGRGKECGLMLHDLQLDFCRRQAETMKTNSVWHAHLLNGYLASEPSTSEASLIADQGDSFERTLLACKPRAWWSVEEDGYILVELARHLVCADLIMELGALLLDARWTYLRGETGGMLALKSEFAFLLSGGDDFRQSFELIWKAIQLSWGRVAEGQRSFLFQVCGRLFNLRMENAVVDAYLKRIEWLTPKPCLLPVNAFFPNHRRALIMEIPVGSYCGVVECSPCGRFVASGADSEVVVADALTGEILRRLQGHTYDVSCLSFAAGSRAIVSGSDDNSIAVWEWETSGSPVRVLKGHSECVTGVAVSSDGGKVFSCAHDRTLRIWEVSTGVLIQEFLQPCYVECVAISNDDQFVAIGLEDGTLKVTDSNTGKTIFEDTDAHASNIYSVVFSPASPRLVTGSRDGTVRLWDMGAWASIGQTFEGHTGWTRCVRFSPDGRQILSGFDDGTVWLWDTYTGTNTWTSANVYSFVTSVAFSPDGGTIFSGCADGIIRTWDTVVEAEATDFEYGHSAPVEAVALSHDGLQVVSGDGDGSVCLWDSRTGNQIGHPLKGHAAAIKCVSFSYDGRQVVSGSDDRTVRLWNAQTFLQIKHPLRGHTGPVSCVSFSSDGRRIVSGSGDSTIRIWDAESGMQIGDALKVHNDGSVLGVAESGDGQYLVSRDEYDEVIIWNLDERTIVWKSDEWHTDFDPSSLSRNESALRHTVTDEEAKKIIWSCGQEAPHLWPKSFPAYSAGVYCREGSVYSRSNGEPTLLGTLPSRDSTWKYNGRRNLFVAGLESGSIAMCELKCDGGYPSDTDGAATSCDGLSHESAISKEVRDTLGTPICYSNGGELVSSMFSCPSGGAVKLWFSNMVSRLSRMYRFDENEALYLASMHRNHHDECVMVWNAILSETMSNWFLLNCDVHERKWKAQSHGGRVLFEKVKSQSFIIFMCDFFMAYDDESDLVVIIVPLSKAVVVSPGDFCMVDLLEEVPEEQAQFLARRLVQLTSILWKYDCLAKLEQGLTGAERLLNITKLFKGKRLDLGPCALEALVGCKVGIVRGVSPGSPYSHRVGLEICGTAVLLKWDPSEPAQPEKLLDLSITEDNSITDYIDICIGGLHDEGEPVPDITGTCAQKELNLSYVPQNKDFEDLREKVFDHPKDLEKAFIDLGYGRQFSEVLRRVATSCLRPEEYTVEKAQRCVLETWNSTTHVTSEALTFNLSKKEWLQKRTPFLVINGNAVYVVKSHKKIQKNVNLALKFKFLSAGGGLTSAPRDIMEFGPVSSLLDAAEKLHGEKTRFLKFDGQGDWFIAHPEGMSNILCALAFISVMLKGKVDPCGVFGGCVPSAKPKGQEVDFNIPIPYGLAKRTFAAGYEPNIINAVEESGPIYSLNGRGWNPEENYTMPAVLAASRIREEVKAALLAEAQKRTSNEAPETPAIEPTIIRQSRQIVQGVRERILRHTVSERT